MKLLITGGARPNFMKLAPIIREIKKYPEIEYKIVHTGQHYDDNMNDIFFRELDIPKPDYNLQVGSSSHAIQTANIMIKFEPICIKENPDIVIVIGDVNSTIACALVASKLKIKIAHIESGYRSYNNKMPEEINRICVDAISDYLFCSNSQTLLNLLDEKYQQEKTFLVGDTMVDNLFYNINKIKTNPYLNIKYITVTIHRDINTDNKERLENILRALSYLSNNFKIIFPIHPRTKKQIDKFNLNNFLTKMKVLPPLGYIEFLSLVKNSNLIITDSGGLQREAFILNIPSIVLRETTEHVDILRSGHSMLVDSEYMKIITEAIKRMNPTYKLKEVKNELDDGKAAERIIKILQKKCS